MLAYILSKLMTSLIKYPKPLLTIIDAVYNLVRPSIATFFSNEATTLYPTYISPEASDIMGCVDVVAADGYEIESIVS